MNSLHAFRSALYTCFSKRADALFELTDALITGGPQPSPVHLSLQPQHRRGWGSLYAALSRGDVDSERLKSLLSKHPLTSDCRPVYAVDVSVWSRCDAEASPERGFYYHPSRHSAGQSIVAGWAYQWIAQLGFSRDSWTAPLDVRRVHPTENAYIVAVEQISRLLHHNNPAVTANSTSSGQVPVFVFDAGYEPAQLAEELASSPTHAAILVRLRSGRCFHGDPPSPNECGTGRGTPGGRPRRHGRKFECYNPATWPVPSFEHHCHDAQYGQVSVRAWCGLHSKTQSHSTIGTRKARPISKGTLVMVEVSTSFQKDKRTAGALVVVLGTGCRRA